MNSLCRSEVGGLDPGATPHAGAPSATTPISEATALRATTSLMISTQHIDAGSRNFRRANRR